MPNWVVNKLSIDGVDNISEFLKDVIDKDENLDFDKIIPMPKSLKLPSGSVQNSQIEAYLTAINPDCPSFKVDGFDKVSTEEFDAIKGALNRVKFLNKFTGRLEPEKFSHDVEDAIKASASRKKIPGSYEPDINSAEEYVGIGKQYVTNLKEYGALDWYDWCCDNWGTKWNASGTICYGKEISFETAWALPVGVLTKLSEMYPNRVFHVNYADENFFGGNCGRVCFENGEMISIEQPETQAQTVGFSCEVWECDPAEYGFYKDENGIYHTLKEKENDGASCEDLSTKISEASSLSEKENNASVKSSDEPEK